MVGERSLCPCVWVCCHSVTISWKTKLLPSADTFAVASFKPGCILESLAESLRHETWSKWNDTRGSVTLEWQSKPQLFHFWSSFLLIHEGRQEKMTQVPRPRLPCGRTTWNSWLLVISPWPSPDYCSHFENQSMDSRSFSHVHTLYLLNK